MRKAAGIILIALGVLFILHLIIIRGITTYSEVFDGSIEGLYTGVFIVVLAVSTAFNIGGGILCLWREYWRVCLASASFAVFFGLYRVVLFYWIDWTVWVIFVAAVIAVIFILRTKKEWQEVSD